MARNPYANFEPVPHQPQQAPEGIAEFRRNLQESFHNGTPKPFLHVNELDDASLTHLSTADIHNLSDVEIMNTPHEVLKRLPDSARTTWLSLRQAVIDKYATMSPAALNEEIKHQPGLVDSLQGDIEELLPHETQEALDRARHQAAYPMRPIFGRRRSRQAGREDEQSKLGKERLVVIESDLLAEKLGEGKEIVVPAKSEPIVPAEDPVDEGSNDPGNWLLDRFDRSQDDGAKSNPDNSPKSYVHEDGTPKFNEFLNDLDKGNLDISNLGTATVPERLVRAALREENLNDEARAALVRLAADYASARYRPKEPVPVAFSDGESGTSHSDETLVPEGAKRLDPSRPQTDVVGNLTHRDTVDTVIKAPEGAPVADLNTAYELLDALNRGALTSSLTSSTVSETAASALLDQFGKGDIFLSPPLKERLELIVSEHQARRSSGIYAPVPEGGSFVDKIKGIRSSLRAYFGLDTVYFDFGAEQKPDKAPEKAPQTGPSFKEDAIAFVSGHIKPGEWMEAGKKWVGDLKIGDTLKSVTLPTPPKIKVPKVALPKVEWKEAFDKADERFEKGAKVAVGVGAAAVKKLGEGYAYVSGTAMGKLMGTPEGRKKLAKAGFIGMVALTAMGTLNHILTGDSASHSEAANTLGSMDTISAPPDTGQASLPPETSHAPVTTTVEAPPTTHPETPQVLTTTPPPETTTVPPTTHSPGSVAPGGIEQPPVETPKPPVQPPVDAEVGTSVDSDSSIWQESKEYLEAHGIEATDARIDMISDTRRELMGNLSEFDATQLSVGTKLPTFSPAELARLVEEADKLSAK